MIHRVRTVKTDSHCVGTVQFVVLHAAYGDRRRDQEVRRLVKQGFSDTRTRGPLCSPFCLSALAPPPGPCPWGQVQQALSAWGI